MVNSIIIQHLKSNKRLVVPGFGAFIKKDDTGEVVFVEFLKKDDGVLSTALQQNFGLEPKEAAEIIDNYVVSTKRHILNTGNFIIGGLGTMHIDANSIYNFDYNPTVTADKQVKPSNTSNPIANTSATIAGNKQSAKPNVEQKPIAVQQIQQSVQQVQQTTPAQQVQQAAQAQATTTQAQQPRFEARKETSETNTERKINNSQKDSTIDVTGLRYQKPIKPIIPGQNKKKTDTVMMIAIIAATLAIVAMIYGLFTSSNPELTIEPSTINTEQSQSIPADSIKSK